MQKVTSVTWDIYPRYFDNMDIMAENDKIATVQKTLELLMANDDLGLPLKKTASVQNVIDLIDANGNTIISDKDFILTCYGNNMIRGFNLSQNSCTLNFDTNSGSKTQTVDSLKGFTLSFSQSLTSLNIISTQDYLIFIFINDLYGFFSKICFYHKNVLNPSDMLQYIDKSDLLGIWIIIL